MTAAPDRRPYPVAAEVGGAMCRNIQQLRGAQPAATDDEIRDAALQFVRKVSGYRQPSAANREVFDGAVDRISAATADLLDGLVITGNARPTVPLQRQRAAQTSRPDGPRRR